jgi:hypothetical protein
MSSMLGSYHSKTGLTPTDLRNEFLSERPNGTQRDRPRGRPG